MDLTQDDIIGNNLLMTVTEYAIILKQHPIPLNWKTLGMWEEQENPTRLGMDSLMKYFEPIHSIFKNKFPRHEYLASNDPQEWWVKLKRGLMTALSLGKVKGCNEVFDPKIRSLYIVNQPGHIRFDDDESKMVALEGIDIKSILRTMMLRGKKYGGKCYEHRAMLLTAALSVARGGEVKFLRYSDWVYDPRFRVTDIGWSELKNIKKYAMPQVNTFYEDAYEVDWYHAMGCFGACENGFMSRSETAKDFVFQNLHNILDQSVAKQLTKSIRNAINPYVSKEIRLSYTSKSIRKGGISELCAHAGLRYPEENARSGHSTGTHMDTYIDNVGLALSLPGALAMNGYKDVRSPVHPPSFECLGIHNQKSVNLFLLLLFPTDHPDLMPDGRLRALITIMGATPVMG